MIAILLHPYYVVHVRKRKSIKMPSLELDSVGAVKHQPQCVWRVYLGLLRDTGVTHGVLVKGSAHAATF